VNANDATLTVLATAHTGRPENAELRRPVWLATASAAIPPPRLVIARSRPGTQPPAIPTIEPGAVPNRRSKPNPRKFRPSRSALSVRRQRRDPWTPPEPSMSRNRPR
jgi:hypothetical protein